MSENIGGPGYQWVRKMNARERNDCIINSGEENNKVAQMIEAATERRNMQGGKGIFYLTIDATEVAKFLEMLHAHGAIIFREYPQHLIPIDGMDKINVQELLDGNLEEHGKVYISIKVKVTVM